MCLFGIVGSCIFVFLTLLALNYSFLLKDMHNDHLQKKESGDLSVDLEIKEEDYEMFADYELDNLNIHLEENNFQELNRIASKEYGKVMGTQSDIDWVKGEKAKLKITDAEIDNSATTVVANAMVPSVHPIGKRDVTVRIDREFAISDHNTEEKEDSDSMSKKVYYAVNTGKYESGFRILDSIKEIASLNVDTNCTVEDASGIGIGAIKFLFTDYRESRHPYKTLAIHLCNIVVIWLFVYLVVAIPLWCNKGWCCCFLCCKFFKPQETIQEAKKYLLLNPPGILITKRGGIINYEPTEREIDCYEEFGHFIRTL